MKMIVHDLKTPLTSVLASLEMVTDGDFGVLTTVQKRVLADAEYKAEELLSLINDLLEVARIEDANLRLNIEPLAPGAFIADLVAEWEVRLAQEGAVVAVDVDDDSPVFEGDKAILKRLFSNLMQNALVHSMGSGVAIELRARADGEGILFAVSDNGPGIPEEYHEVIFQKFRQVKEPRLPNVRSSGLGLAFCKLAAEAHGGRIWVKSREGEGSTFFVRLPTIATTAAERSA